MNFFEQQDRARASTFYLVLLFALGVGVLVLLTSFAAVLAFSVMEQKATHGRAYDVVALSQFLLPTAAVIISVVLLGALYRTSQLRSGGKAVAEMMGGRLLHADHTDLDERKILNVVEEMAIASGVQVPPVYLIEDDAINAFAAGFKSQDAVIGITRGAIRLLDRDELQGVIAHEFSHIFNGDMRLNLRLIGWLHGLLLIALIGQMLMRSQRYVGSSRKNGAGTAIFLAGLAFFVLGYAGVFFGNLIKAAVSRQREYLADASAVQFTRNPDGIGSALKKIGGYALGSRMLTRETTEVGHLLFGEGGISGLLATHPPLETRIRRIDPHWDGKMIEPDVRKIQSSPARSPNTAARVAGVAVGLESGLIESVGNPSRQSIEEAGRQLAQIPGALHEHLHSPLAASLALYSLPVIYAGGIDARAQLQLLQQRLPAACFKQLGIVIKLMQELPRELDLTVIAMMQSALRQQSANQQQELLNNLLDLIHLDGNLSVQEWAVLSLARYYQAEVVHSDSTVSLPQCHSECVNLLSLLVKTGHASEVMAKAAFDKAWSSLSLGPATYRPESTLDDLDAALTRLVHLKPLQKPALLKAMLRAVQHDGRITAAEYTLLRTIAALLDCPLPPL